MSENTPYTAEQAARANTVLRDALDLPPQQFSAEQFVGMISDEIELLRKAGRSDQEIAGLLKDGAGIEIEAGSISRFYVQER